MVAAAALLPAATIEVWYARGLYPAIARRLVPLTSAAPFPVSAAIATIALLAFVAGVGRALVRRRGLGRRLLEGLAGLAAIVLWFYLTWGLNYGRPAAAELLALPPVTATPERWTALANDLAAVVAAHADAPADPAGAVAALAGSLETFSASLTGAPVALPGRVRSLPAGTLLRGGFAGVVSPFTLEAHVDAGLPEAARVAVAGHELAHLAGFAGEADAELISALAGLQAPHPYARYATALRLWSGVAGQLPEATSRELLEALPARARADLRSWREAALGYRRDGLARRLTALYDRYLRSQRVAAGVGDYDRGLALLLRARAGGWLAAGDAAD